MVERVDTTLFKGLLILETLAASPLPLGITEISRQLKLNKSNVFRLIQTLCKTKYVVQQPDRTYRPTMKIWRVGINLVGHHQLCLRARPAMNQLAKVTGETVLLSVLEGLRTLYIEKIESNQPVRAYADRGATAPLHCVATGKVLLGFDYSNLRGPIAGMLTRHTQKTITDPAVLDAEIRAVLRAGYAINAGEYRDDVGGVAAPVFAQGSGVVAALGISGPLQRLTRQRMKELGPLVARAAKSISGLE